ncbi:MAG: thermonuclease family protein [Alphaproteobacteria bacterium]|nr:thermonuclease family protein [Alphaproteobacteria bacterium]
MAWLLALLALLLAQVVAASASSLPAGLPAGPPGLVVTVIDGDTLRLDDGREVRLVGIQAPKLPLGRAGFPTWPLAEEAKAALERMALRASVTPHFGGAREDRHGRLLAHLVTAEGRWLQGAMLEGGMARVYTFPDNRSAAREMLALEAAARAARLGIWRLDHYRVRQHGEVAQLIDTFQLVEGRVLRADQVRDHLYLNFGADWRDDFTIRIARRNLRLFQQAGEDPAKFAGRTVRVRGWLRRLNGPMIEVTHPEQIEALPALKAPVPRPSR